MIKIMSKRNANTGDAPASKRRPNFTGAEMEVLLQNVYVSILFHYGYIHTIWVKCFIYLMPFAVFV